VVNFLFHKQTTISLIISQHESIPTSYTYTGGISYLMKLLNRDPHLFHITDRCFRFGHVWWIRSGVRAANDKADQVAHQQLPDAHQEHAQRERQLWSAGFE
jgi:hypothetical protein